MKKILIVIFIVLLVFTGCSGEKTKTEELTVNPPKVEESAMLEQPEEVDSGEKVFNAESLAEFDGKDGNAAYVAVDGVVYDVSEVPAWQGLHQGKLIPGKDYSNEIRESPHGLANLEGLPIVGTYTEESETKESGY